jgi:hypothetical protein
MKYASFLVISRALHLDVFDQPVKNHFFNNLRDVSQQTVKNRFPGVRPAGACPIQE